MRSPYTILLLIVALCFQNEIRANESSPALVIDLDEVNIQSGFRDTQSKQAFTTAISTLSAFQLQVQKIDGFKALNGLIPNVCIADYGSRLSSAVYIRGIGSRSSGQSIGMYVDNVPIMDKSAFDLEFMDLQGIEVLRGPQGTLFGRNAMGGIIHLHSLSPFDFTGTKLAISGGSYGYQKINASHYMHPTERLGVANQFYYTQNDGYFTNIHTQKKADNSQSFGARSRVLFRPKANTLIQYSLLGERTIQQAFPYQQYNSERDSLEGVKMNDPSAYSRFFLMQSLYIEQQRKNFSWSSSSSHQFLKDHMLLDQDFSPASIFTLDQRQVDHSVSQEWIIKSLPNKDRQWTWGAFGFYSRTKTDAPVLFKEDGMSDILQANIDRNLPDSINFNNMRVPIQVRLDATTMRIEGKYSTPNWGVALFHQSTLNNFLVDRLSLTLGLRVDYESVSLNHLTEGVIPFSVLINHNTMGSFSTPVQIKGNEQTSTLEWLPKLGLHYQFNPNQGGYISVNKGYKSGGYNFQLFSDIIQEQMKTNMMRIMPNNPGPGSPEIPISQRIKYTPETSWNYELGWTFSDPKNRFKLAANTFYMQINDMQMMQFAPGGSGRMIKNAGKATSSGLEITSKTKLTDEFILDVNYGFNHAVFSNYEVQIKNSTGGIDTFNYAGNSIPYAPAHTLSVGFQYLKSFHNGLIDQCIVSCQYMGQGKIYWNEANTLYQEFYSTVNAKFSIRKGSTRLDFWIQNATNTAYNSFYFESLGKQFFQAGKPFRTGIELNFQF